MWRSLLARGAVFYAMRTKLSEFCDYIEQSAHVRRLMGDLEIHAQECAAHDADDEATVLRIIAALDNRLLELLALEQVDAGARDLMAQLRALSRCARSIDPFRALFVGVSGYASTVYGDGWRTPSLALSHLGRHPRPAGEDPYPVTAATPWPPQESSAEVELRIHCAAFGPAAFAVLPMLFTHECICHVPARQDRAANDSWFAEGLLDWVAYVYFENWVVKLDHELAPAARRHAELLRTVLTSDKSREGVARRGGHDAARTLQAWFEYACDHTVDEAKLTVARLAVQLNTVDRPLAEKDKFVSFVGQPLPPALEDALRRWEAGDLQAEALLDVGV
ncbi:hypothetical protein ACU61A_21755 [Pseudonocardia sichuanensis]